MTHFIEYLLSLAIGFVLIPLASGQSINDATSSLRSEQPALGRRLVIDRKFPLPLTFSRTVEPTPPGLLPTSIQQTEFVPVMVDDQALEVGFEAGAGNSNERLNRSSKTNDKWVDSLVTVGSALSIVLGLYFGLVWLSKKIQRRAAGRNGGIPEEVVHVLGEFRLSDQHEAHIVRFGSKLLALSVTPNGYEKLAEINDPEEVDFLTKVCLHGTTGTMPARISDMLAHEHGMEPLANQRR